MSNNKNGASELVKDFLSTRMRAHKVLRHKVTEEQRSREEAAGINPNVFSVPMAKETFQNPDNVRKEICEIFITYFETFEWERLSGDANKGCFEIMGTSNGRTVTSKVTIMYDPLAEVCDVTIKNNQLTDSATNLKDVLWTVLPSMVMSLLLGWVLTLIRHADDTKPDFGGMWVDGLFWTLLIMVIVLFFTNRWKRNGDHFHTRQLWVLLFWVVLAIVCILIFGWGAIPSFADLQWNYKVSVALVILVAFFKGMWLYPRILSYTGSPKDWSFVSFDMVQKNQSDSGGSTSTEKAQLRTSRTSRRQLRISENAGLKTEKQVVSQHHPQPKPWWKFW